MSASIAAPALTIWILSFYSLEWKIWGVAWYLIAAAFHLRVFARWRRISLMSAELGFKGLVLQIHICLTLEVSEALSVYMIILYRLFWQRWLPPALVHPTRLQECLFAIFHVETSKLRLPWVWLFAFGPQPFHISHPQFQKKKKSQTHILWFQPSISLALKGVGHLFSLHG